MLEAKAFGFKSFIERVLVGIGPACINGAGCEAAANVPFLT